MRIRALAGQKRYLKETIGSVGKQIREKVMALPGLRDLELNLFLTMTGSGL